MNQRNVAQVIMQGLEAEGIDHVFGIPGLHTLELWNALYDSNIKTIVTRHEQAAAMAADGYARVAGKPAAVLAITGPGATNTLTGVATAYADSTPMLVITGEVHSDYLGRDCETTHELADQSLLFQGVTAFQRTITRPEAAAEALRSALTVLKTERPRPVQLSVPTNIQASPVPEVTTALQGHKAAPLVLEDQALEQLMSLLGKAKRPLIYCGGGAQKSAPWITSLAEKLGAAVLVTPAGRGVIADDHPLALGCGWTKATRNEKVEKLLSSCDLMLAIGVSFGGNPTGMWSLPIPETLVHIDISAGMLGKFYQPTLAIKARAEEVLPAVVAQLGASQGDRADFHQEVTEVYHHIQENCPPQTRLVLGAIRSALGREGILVNDVTVIAYSAGTYYPVYAPGTYLSPAKFGTLGFGLPAAIGAKLAAPGQPVVAICGDGGFMLNIHELATAAQEQLSLPIVVHNNHGYNAIRHSQDKFFNKRHIGVDLHTPDLAKLAEAFAVPYALPGSPEALEQSLKAALQRSLPTVIEWRHDLEFPW